MMTLPNDPMMLFSYINTLLRDQYTSLDDLCAELDVDPMLLKEKLASVGFEYNAAANKFW